jgi:hypothetical protein
MLIYLFIGMAFRHYTTLNLLLLLWFIRSFRKKMEQSILSKNALTEYVRLILRFLNMIIMILLLENGLLVNIIITLFLERSLKKKWNRKLNVLDVSPEQLLLGQRNLYAVWKSKVNERSTWLWLTLGIALECAGWLCTKRSAFLDGTGRLLCAGLPQAEYFFCLLMMLVMACLVYYILFYKNPMGLHSTSWEAGLVCLLFLIGCLTLMQTGGTDIAASKTEWGMQVKIANQIRKGEGQQVQSGYGYLLTGTRSENLTQRITNRMTAIPLSSKGYTGYEYWDLFPKQIDARTESYLIESVDTNGTATFAVFWYPALLEAFFNGSLQ